MTESNKHEPTWQLYVHVVSVGGLAVILSAFATGGSFRILLIGVVLMSFGAAHSLYEIVRYIAQKRQGKV